MKEKNVCFVESYVDANHVCSLQRHNKVTANTYEHGLLKSNETLFSIDRSAVLTVHGGELKQTAAIWIFDGGL